MEKRKNNGGWCNGMRLTETGKWLVNVENMFVVKQQ